MYDPEKGTRSLYDLHLHTCWSYDALATVTELFDGAAEAGVRYIAVTDHHVIDSVPEAKSVAAGHPDVAYIPAGELTVHCSIGAVDMVCLGFTDAAIDALADVWDVYHQWQCEYGASLCAGMQAAGFDYTDAHREELLASYRTPEALSIQGMTHVANKIQRAYFIERGFIDSDAEYGQVLSAAGQEVRRPSYPSTEFVLPRVKSQGALVIIAHPTRYFLEDNRERMDLLREELLLDGVECAHSGVPEHLTPVYRAYCEEHGLVSSGGTDLHWSEDVRDKIGTHIGPDEWWTEIAARLPEGVIVNG